MKSVDQLNTIKRIKAIAETGLVYAENAYDQERYEEIREIALNLMAEVSGRPLYQLHDFFVPENDYPTPKVDVRGFILNEKDEILMAQESVDGKWTIPGGWADIGHAPSEVVVKEIREETGMEAEIVRLLAVYDKQRHAHPPEAHYIYKLMFHCRVIGGKLQAGFDMNGADWFSLHDLPPLSKPRILQEQLNHLYKLVKGNIVDVYFD